MPDFLLKNSAFVRRAGIVRDPDKFDAAFFNYSHIEAQHIDPQHRLFLECAWHAFENAGYNPDHYKGTVGVYAGCGINNYLMKNLLSGAQHMEAVVTPMTFCGNDKDFLTTRVSYKLNLSGPSIDIQTACSTSLVAVQLACQALLTHQCDMALSGGVSLQTPRMKGYLHMDGQILSKDGYCRAFDQNASGTVFGEGVGIVVLKRLSDAIKDRDTVYAVIKAICVNNDGSDKVSFTAPSVNRQAEIIAAAHSLANIQAEDISYVETHGTGTVLGDSIEATALTQAFRQTTPEKGFCRIGSVKPNIGHLDVAAGVAGLMKTALALKHRKIPASLYCPTPHPDLNLENSPFVVNNALTDWKTNGKPRMAGLSAFGMGGTNAHAILCEPPAIERRIAKDTFYILPLSARTQTALKNTIRRLSLYLQEHRHINMADAAYTMQIGRKHFSHRSFVICQSTDDAVSQLKTLDSSNHKHMGQKYFGVVPHEGRQVVFMFSGQGSQYLNMSRDLYAKIPVFQKTMDRCTAILQPFLKLDLRSVIYPSKDGEKQAAQLLNQTYITQPALFAVEYALAQYFIQCGVSAGVMIGHSIGEYVAACLSGVFSLENALKIVAARGRLMQDQEKGAMLAAQISETEALELLEDNIALAAVNSPNQCVFSGATASIDRLETKLKNGILPLNRPVRCTRLNTSHAFHSAMMQPAVEDLKAQLKHIQLNAPQIPFISNVTGRWITPEQAVDPAYWAGHIRQTVRFSDGIHTILQQSPVICLEIGPGMTLTPLAKAHFSGNQNGVTFAAMRRSDQAESDYLFALTALGGLWANGGYINWKAYQRDEKYYRIPLPTYPFERERYWIEAELPIAETGKEICELKPKLSGLVGFFNQLLNKMVNGDKHNPSREGQKLEHRFESEVLLSSDASTQEIEKRLITIWQKALGIDRIGIHDDFFELGGHSLLAARVFAEIEKQTGKKIPISILYEASTIAQLANVLEDKDVENNYWDSLVEIQGEGTNPPLFCIHSEGGNVLEYRDFSKHLGKDQPFYTLQAQGLSGDNIGPTSIEQMASHYIKEIKKKQPAGPYYIGGYCLGGVIAFEMARQLENQREQVAFLGLIGTGTPDYLDSYKPGITFVHKLFYKLKLRIALEMNNLYVLNWKEKINYIKERIDRLLLPIRVGVESIADNVSKRLHMGGVTHSQDYKLEMLRKYQNQAFFAYQPPRIKSHTLMFWPIHQDLSYIPDPSFGFQAYTENDVEDYAIDCFHKNIMKEPNVKKLAEKYSVCLKKAQALQKQSFSGGESHPCGMRPRP